MLLAALVTCWALVVRGDTGAADAAKTAPAGQDFTGFVDPRIGNVAPLLVPTFPTFSLPNQMLRMVPAKADYLEDQVSGFPLQVFAHRTPGILPMRVSLGPITPEAWTRKMTIDHDLEVMRPWHYSTYLIDDGIRVSFSPARKAAIYKIDFPRGDAGNLLFSGTDSARISAIGPNAFAVEEKVSYKTRGTESVTRTMSVYFYGEIADPQGKSVPGIQIEASERTLSVTRPATAPPSLLLKYAVSYVSPEQAKKNFAAEVASSGFEDLVARGKAEWARVLGRIAVEGGSEAQKRSFYTALYRTHERMVDINEGGRYYSGYDGKVHESARPFYVDDWIWDTYLAQHPLRTILDPGMQSDILNSYTLMYEQSGWMPTFPQVHGNHMCMNSYHSAAIFLDGHRKGISGFDMHSAYAGIRKNLTEATLLPWRQGLPKVALDDFFHAKGYYPALRPGQTESEPEVDSFEKRQAVAVTLGVSYDAWVLAQLARDFGKQEDHERFSRVAQNYRNLWHPGQRLFMPKDDQGEWITIDPKRDGGPGYRDYYDENNGWTYAWQVQHDIDGLIGLLGGRKATEERLDQLFREPLGMPKNRFYVDGANATGLVGQFAMGNEPAFHIPYLYNYVGAPWKTQKRIRFLLDVWFKDNIFGIPGDEDGGGMSAFVVFSSIGLYPVTPGLPHYAITSPVFEKTTLTLPNGKTFAIVAKGASPQRKYIQKASLNGRELDAPFITHADVVSGGTLELVLADLPNREWGSKAVVAHR